MSSDDAGETVGGRRLLARAYDDTDDEHIADLYSWEAVDQLKDAWWVRVEEVEDAR